MLRQVRTYKKKPTETPTDSSGLKPGHDTLVGIVVLLRAFNRTLCLYKLVKPCYANLHRHIYYELCQYWHLHSKARDKGA